MSSESSVISHIAAGVAKIGFLLEPVRGWTTNRRVVWSLDIAKRSDFTRRRLDNHEKNERDESIFSELRPPTSGSTILVIGAPESRQTSGRLGT
jgi:hypothetical protein